MLFMTLPAYTSPPCEDLYDKYGKLLFRVSYAILCSREDAEDAVQETVITAFKQLSNLRDDSLFKSWLFKILSNQCKSQLKKNKKNPDLLPEDDYIFLIEDESVNKDFNQIERDEFIETVDERDQLIIGYMKEGLNQTEVADILGISPQAVQQRVSRFRAKWRKVNGKY